MIGLVHCYSSSILFVSFFIGPESDPWIPLIDVTLVCEDTNSKLVEVVTVAQILSKRLSQDFKIEVQARS